jgi:hypothetical protein
VGCQFLFVHAGDYPETDFEESTPPSLQLKERPLTHTTAAMPVRGSAFVEIVRRETVPSWRTVNERWMNSGQVRRSSGLPSG